MTMPPSTAWRRRDESITSLRRGSSPSRPTADSIERISPEPPSLPTTPTTAHNKHTSSARTKNDVEGPALQGLGLSYTALNDVSPRARPDHDHLYLDSNGRAHLGAKGRSQRNISKEEHGAHTARKPGVRSSTTLYRGPPKKTHVRTASSMSIDDLANIAIATSPQFTTSNSAFTFGASPIFQSASRPNTSYINGYHQDSFDRPAKRIKSERLFSAEWSHHDERPHSSYTYNVQTEVRQEDAELLLSLQNGFSFRNPDPRPLPPSQPPLMQTTIPEEEHPHPLDAPSEPQANRREETIPIEETGDTIMPSEAHPSDESIAIFPHSTSATIHESTVLPDNHMKSEETEGSEAQLEEETVANETPEKEDDEDSFDPTKLPPIQASTGTIEHETEPDTEMPDAPLMEDISKKTRRIPVQTQLVCPACNQMQSNGREGEATIDWIKCEGSCERWYHIPCAGFSDQEVKKVNQFICTDCEPMHGKTTYARTSSRTRTLPDYAALNEGVTKSSEDSVVHHFVARIKDGTITYKHDDYARIRPELLTEEFWENMDGTKRPFVVPAAWNPRFGQLSSETAQLSADDMSEKQQETYITFTSDGEVIKESSEIFDATTGEHELEDEQVADVNQDYLDMVMPRDLTVRQVAELYGPNLDVPVIDVKTQGVKGKFTLAKWANYYEDKSNKPIRNVISLEVSNSPLGRLIRRPKVVRDIDLEAQVWDAKERSATQKRPIAFYCLMSVGDSYTDFHIDFGGSSVYYHILKGMKTFFFIPPEDKYLKKYQEWCDSPTQNDTWLPDLCDGNVTRVDLHPGDTAFIPAGWIHSVWTPMDSLVIGGNFLTRYDLENQIKVTEIEKANGVPQKFRYPYFQKVMWYTLIKYLEDDPVPESIIQTFQNDLEYRYLRANPVWMQDIQTAEDGPEEVDYNARNYSKSELQGLPALRDFLYRTARVHAELPVDNITTKQRESIKASIPKNHGDPLQLICLFAIWVAWKIGNVPVPEWVHADTQSEIQQEIDKNSKEKARKSEVFRVPPERVSSRRKNQASPAPLSQERQETPDSDDLNRSNAPSKLPYPRIACESCRTKRQKCQHLPGIKIEETAKETLEKTRVFSNVNIDIPKLARASPVVNTVESAPQPAPPVATTPAPAPTPAPTIEETVGEMPNTTDLAQAALARMSSQPPESNGMMVNGATPTPGSAKKGRSKACDECRKSKRRCVHDEHGRVDPAKAAEPSKPRGSNSSKRPPRLSDEHQAKRAKTEDEYAIYLPNNDIDAMIDPALMGPIDPMLEIQFQNPSVPFSDINAISTPPRTLTTHSSSASTTQPTQSMIDPNLDPELQSMMDPNLDPALMDESVVQSDVNQDAVMSDNPYATDSIPLPLLTTMAAGTPDLDKSFSPITATEVASKHDSEEEQLQTTPLVFEAQQQQVDSIMHVGPESIPHPTIELQPQPNETQRRHSSAATGASPKPEIMSPSSRRSSSNTSGTTHHAAAVIEGAIVQDEGRSKVQERQASPRQLSTRVVDASPRRDNQGTSPTIKQEAQAATTPTREFSRADTAASEASDPELDASLKLAQELQAQEHGLRRRQSVRSS